MGANISFEEFHFSSLEAKQTLGPKSDFCHTLSLSPSLQRATWATGTSRHWLVNLPLSTQGRKRPDREQREQH